MERHFYRVLGEHAGLVAALEGAGMPGVPVLVWVTAAAAGLGAQVEAFAAGLPVGQDAVFMVVMAGGAANDLAQAELVAVTRAMALTWAARRVRINSVLSNNAPLADLVGTVQAIAGWPSMTGQVIRLGACA